MDDGEGKKEIPLERDIEDKVMVPWHYDLAVMKIQG